VVYGSKPYQLMVIQQANAAGAIYDHAGRNTQSMFVTNLNAEVGEQPRAIDKAVTNNREAVEAKVELVINDVARRTNMKLGFNRGN